MKKILENITHDEFIDYLQDIESNLEYADFYWGDVNNELQISFSNARIKYGYSQSVSEPVVEVIYEKIYDHETDTYIYNVYE